MIGFLKDIVGCVVHMSDGKHASWLSVFPQHRLLSVLFGGIVS